MGYAQDLVNAGYYGYAGWGDAAAAADFNATGGSGKGGPSYGSSGSGGFSFDFEGEVNKAFDELSSYYNDLLTESKGDVDLAISRMVEDYDTGNRYRKVSYNLSSEALNIAQETAMKNDQLLRKSLIKSELNRGISRKSAFDQAGGLGIADTERSLLEGDLARQQGLRDLQRQELDTGFNQTNELATTALERGKYDITEKQRRYARDLAEQQKKEAADIATSRMSRAFNRFEASLF